MEYMHVVAHVVHHHSTRSVLVHEIPHSSWLRGEHELVHHLDGSPRCIACRLCSTTCPSYAITLSVGVSAYIARDVVSYSLCSSRCIYCGWCDSVCPTSSIHHGDVLAVGTTSRRTLHTSTRLCTT
uniref:NADH dehydrogenase subunit 8 n=1 Tax=Lacrimia lanifica TaxID=2016125 RepID=A0A6G5ZUW2_9EUGL|nr:NADH dehydrogenase subunit 8 [Lacrimia lanifica]